MNLFNNLPSLIFGGLIFFTMQAPSVPSSPQIPTWAIEILKGGAALLATFVFHKIQKRYSNRLQKSEQAIARTLDSQQAVAGELTILRGQMITMSESLQSMSEARNKAEELNDDYEADSAELQAEVEKLKAEKQQLTDLLEASNSGLSSLSLHLDEQDEHIYQMQLQLQQQKGAEMLAKELADQLEKRFPVVTMTNFAETLEQIRGYAETLNINKARRTQEMPHINVEGDPNAS